MKAYRAVLCVILGMCLGALLTASSRPAQAALWWFHGVRDKQISVCFAGDAVSVRPDHVREIVGHLQHFEYAANIQFITTTGTRARDEVAPGGNIDRLACPDPTWGDRPSFSWDAGTRHRPLSTSEETGSAVVLAAANLVVALIWPLTPSVRRVEDGRSGGCPDSLRL